MLKLNPDQYGLSFHTNTPQLGLSINNFNGDHRQGTFDLGKDLSSHLHQYLMDFIKPQTWSNIAFLAVAKGPGGFTGTRLGIVMARTICQQLNLPIYTISNLAAIAHFTLAELKFNQDQQNLLLAVEMNTMRGQLFGGIYQGDPHNFGIKTYLEDQVYYPQQWLEILNQLPLPYQRITPPKNIAQTSDNMLELAHQQWQKGITYHWSESLPFYGQHPVTK